MNEGVVFLRLSISLLSADEQVMMLGEAKHGDYVFVRCFIF
jgi:hypothetical protein